MEFFRTDKAWFGFLFGLVVPVIGYMFVNEANELLVKYYFHYGSGISRKFVFILSVCCNLLPFAVARKQRLDHQLQGIVGATLLLSITTLIYILRVYGS